MMDRLSASVGLAATDPMFWMPLALMGLVIFLLAGQIILDGFDVGCGLMMPWFDPLTRVRLLDNLTAWRGANESWIFLLFAVFMAGFPLGWQPVFADLYLPVLLLVAGSVLRSISFEFRARASMVHQRLWNALFSLGAYCSALGLGLWLVYYVSGEGSALQDWVFLALVLLGVGANCVVLACCWVLAWGAGAIRQTAARAGLKAVRWVAAAMMAVSLMLGLTNPAIYYRWTHTDVLYFGVALWLLMLVLFVVLEAILRAVRKHPQTQVRSLAFVVAATINLLMLGGLAYSYFPFLVLDYVTVWDAAATRESLRWIMAAAVVATPVLLVFNVLGYARLFRYRPVRTS